LLQQLKNGGILVIPVGDGAEQKMLKIKKDLNGQISQEEYGTFKFVPMLERKVR
jgi:protein-L-isoaspartate(D-aspartate) O-methyltransferase